jgi:hypothetical protein
VPSKAKQILDLLAAKHTGDVFVPECKNGPTQFTHGTQKMDAWVMKPSWAHPCCICYEIKVNRSDFLRDDKWRGYLDYCNCFYFAAAPGVIDPAELPTEAGLVLASRNLARLYTKKKAPHREVEIPDAVFRYILMSRCEIVREYRPESGGLEYWREWLKEKAEKQDIGHRAGRRLRELYAERVEHVSHDNRRLKAENERFAELRQVCEALKLSPSNLWDARLQVERRLEDLRKQDGVWKRVNEAIDALEALRHIASPNAL